MINWITHELLTEIQFSFTSGNIDSDIIFSFDTETEIDRSCSSTLNGEHFVIGGVNQKRQVYYNYDWKNIWTGN